VYPPDLLCRKRLAATGCQAMSSQSFGAPGLRIPPFAGFYGSSPAHLHQQNLLAWRRDQEFASPGRPGISQVGTSSWHAIGCLWSNQLKPAATTAVRALSPRIGQAAAWQMLGTRSASNEYWYHSGLCDACLMGVMEAPGPAASQ